MQSKSLKSVHHSEHSRLCRLASFLRCFAASGEGEQNSQRQVPSQTGQDWRSSNGLKTYGSLVGTGQVFYKDKMTESVYYLHIQEFDISVPEGQCCLYFLFLPFCGSPCIHPMFDCLGDPWYQENWHANHRKDTELFVSIQLKYVLVLKLTM